MTWSDDGVGLGRDFLSIRILVPLAAIRPTPKPGAKEAANEALLVGPQSTTHTAKTQHKKARQMDQERVALSTSREQKPGLSTGSKPKLRRSLLKTTFFGGARAYATARKGVRRRTNERRLRLAPLYTPRLSQGLICRKSRSSRLVLGHDILCV